MVAWTAQRRSAATSNVPPGCGAILNDKVPFGVTPKNRVGHAPNISRNVPSMVVSKARKLNTTSSTEAELVGVYNGLPDILWGKYF